MKKNGSPIAGELHDTTHSKLLTLDLRRGTLAREEAARLGEGLGFRRGEVRRVLPGHLRERRRRWELQSFDLVSRFSETLLR